MRTKELTLRNGLRLSQVSSCHIDFRQNYQFILIHNRHLISATKVGFMPELKWNDKIVVQSNAITRFVAREVGIAGKNNVEMAQCDAIVDFCSEMVAGRVKVLQQNIYVLMKETLILLSCIDNPLHVCTEGLARGQG